MGGAITSEELTVTLPSSPTVGTEMIIIDSTGDASTNNIVVGRGGSKINGECDDVPEQAFYLVGNLDMVYEKWETMKKEANS